MLVRAGIPCVLIVYYYARIYHATTTSHRRLNRNSHGLSTMDILMVIRHKFSIFRAEPFTSFVDDVLIPDFLMSIALCFQQNKSFAYPWRNCEFISPYTKGLMALPKYTEIWQNMWNSFDKTVFQSTIPVIVQGKYEIIKTRNIISIILVICISFRWLWISIVDNPWLFLET
jgi:hypothetical protein